MRLLYKYSSRTWVNCSDGRAHVTREEDTTHLLDRIRKDSHTALAEIEPFALLVATVLYLSIDVLRKQKKRTVACRR